MWNKHPFNNHNFIKILSLILSVLFHTHTSTKVRPKTHVVESLCRFWKLKIGAISTAETDMDKKLTMMLLLSHYSFLYWHIRTNRRENGIEMYLHKFRLIYNQANRKQSTSTNHNCFCRSHASKNWPRNRTWFSESKIIVVFARPAFRKSVQILNSENRRQFSTPCVFSLTQWTVSHPIACKVP